MADPAVGAKTTESAADECVERALERVSWDGIVDTEALYAQEFTHDLALARSTIAREHTLVRDSNSALPIRFYLRGAQGPGEAVMGQQPMLCLCAPQPDSPGWSAYFYPDDQRLQDLTDARTRPQDQGDVAAALIALTAATSSAMSCGTSLMTREMSYGSRVQKSETWLWRVGAALPLRDVPWDLAAVDRETALARFLVDTIIARHRTTTRAGLPPVAVDRLSADDAAAYNAATAFWDRHALVTWPCDEAMARALRDTYYPLYGLYAFLAAAERMQATPSIYLGCIAPAIAARLQPAYDAAAQLQAPPLDRDATARPV
jgi:hypothetical protein